MMRADTAQPLQSSEQGDQLRSLPDIPCCSTPFGCVEYVGGQRAGDGSQRDSAEWWPGGAAPPAGGGGAVGGGGAGGGAAAAGAPEAPPPCCCCGGLAGDRGGCLDAEAAASGGKFPAARGERPAPPPPHPAPPTTTADPAFSHTANLPFRLCPVGPPFPSRRSYHQVPSMREIFHDRVHAQEGSAQARGAAAWAWGGGGRSGGGRTWGGAAALAARPLPVAVHVAGAACIPLHSAAPRRPLLLCTHFQIWLPTLPHLPAFFVSQSSGPAQELRSLARQAFGQMI